MGDDLKGFSWQRLSDVCRRGSDWSANEASRSSTRLLLSPGLRIIYVPIGRFNEFVNYALRRRLSVNDFESMTQFLLEQYVRSLMRLEADTSQYLTSSCLWK